MKLAFSNIAWTAEMDGAAYSLMRKYGFTGLEIAPTRIFPEDPYSRCDEAKEWADGLYREYGFAVPSIQSIWYGRQEKLFGTEEERRILLEYTGRAILFASAVGSGNIVFGCPRNRCINSVGDEEKGVRFFREIAGYALDHGTSIGMEANPPVYNTNYITGTADAVRLIEEVGSGGFRLNLDLGTMIENGETLRVISENTHLIQHVHISEPGLMPPVPRSLHREVRDMLETADYRGWVSVEMKTVSDIGVLEQVMKYVSEVFL